MADIFCNVENEAFDASNFEDGPENTKIHVTSQPHTLDGWPATRKKGWVIRLPAVRAVDAMRFETR
jgi:hypothetical protein